jgi:hypothetical protein
VITEIRAGGAPSLGVIAKELNARGITTARGGQWAPAQVLRVLTGISSEVREGCRSAAFKVSETPFSKNYGPVRR